METALNTNQSINQSINQPINQSIDSISSNIQETRLIDTVTCKSASLAPGTNWIGQGEINIQNIIDLVKVFMSAMELSVPVRSL